MKKSARYKHPLYITRLWNNLQSSLISIPAGLFFCCTLFPILLAAQADSVQTVLSLPEATILTQRYNRTGYAVWKADSLPTSAAIPLSNRLFWESGLQLRQNAPGTLATISARGAGPNRTAVIWNGLNLQSPMNGVIDAALVPLFQGDRLEVLQGGNSAAQSSGGMGGSVIIESPFQTTRDGWSGNLGLETGSFGWKSAQGTAAYTAGKLSSRTRAQWQSAENDFSFQKKALNGQSFTTRQPNNFAEKSDFQQFNQWVVNHKNLVKTAVWLQNAFRQIPPAATESAANTWQRDRSGRVVATWDYRHDRTSQLQTRIAWQDEYIAFHFAGDTEESRAQTALAAMEWRKKKGQYIEWRAGGTAQHVRAISEGYRQSRSWYDQTRLAGFVLGERTFGAGGKVSAQIRQEWAEKQAAPFTWTMGWEIPTWHTGHIRGHFSRNFNLPTFNDRFWKTLDDLELSPEKGYSADLGWVFQQSFFSAEITAFQLILDDWILWQPGADGIFRPGNLRKVNSRGLEAAGSLLFECWGFHWKTRGRFQWSTTENVAVYGGSEAVLGKQLPYTPAVSAGGGIWAARAGFSGAYLHQFTGKRFITTDNNNRLPGFQTGTLLLRYTVESTRFKRWFRSCSLDVTLENCWNTPYESLANRPMPGRNGRLGLMIGW